VESFVDKDSDVIVEVPEPPVPSDNCTATLGPAPSCETEGKPQSLTSKFTGGTCADSANGQGDKFKCTDYGAFDLGQPVQVIYTGKDPDKITVSPSSVSLGEQVTLEATGRNELHSNSKLEIYQGGDLKQKLEIHTSCSAPLAVGNVFGSLELVKFDGKSAGVEVTYFYEVTNNGDPLSNVLVDDNQLGLIDGPISLASEESQTFTAIAEIFETTINTVNVTGQLADGQTCSAPSDSVIVTVEEPPPPPPGSCADGKPQALVFEYTGETCAASENDQGDKAKCSGDPGGAQPVQIVYTGKDPDKIRVDPSDETIRVGGLVTVEATGRDRLHANTKLEIWQGGVLLQSLEIHTSCSQPLEVGDVFGSLILREFIPED